MSGESLIDRLRPPGSTRWILLLGMEGCEPCHALEGALGAEPFADRSRVSKLVKGDVELRSAHLRLGVRHYPTTLLLDGSAEVHRLEGRVMREGELDLSRHLAFLAGE